MVCGCTQSQLESERHRRAREGSKRTHREDERRRNAVHEELVEHAPHLEQPLGRLLAQDALGRLGRVLLPVGPRHRVDVALVLLARLEERVVGLDRLPLRVLRVERLEREEGAAQVARRDAREEERDVLRNGEALLERRLLQDLVDLRTGTLHQVMLDMLELDELEADAPGLLSARRLAGAGTSSGSGR